MSRPSAWTPFLQGMDHRLLHLGVGDGARHSRPRLVAQPVQPGCQEPGPATVHCVPADPQLGRDACAIAGPRRRPARSAPAAPALERSSATWPSSPLSAGSSGDWTSGWRLVLPILPAGRDPAAQSRPEPEPQTRHDSSGDQATQGRDARTRSPPAGPPEQALPHTEVVIDGFIKDG
jgi:hypothetical protein